MAPIVIALSAKLNTGHTRKSRKSTTYPKNIRSTRLPKAPPNIRHKDNEGRESFFGLFFLK